MLAPLGALTHMWALTLLGADSCRVAGGWSRGEMEQSSNARIFLEDGERRRLLEEVRAEGAAGQS